MNCKQAEELLSLYAGRDLDEKRATLVTEHVQTCAACARVADEYRESVQLTEQFAPPVFSEAVYAGIRRRVLRDIETEAMAPVWPQTVASLFRPERRWAIAGVLLIVVSLFAIYFIVNRGNDEQQLAHELPAKVQPGTRERANSEPQDTKPVDLAPSEKTGGKKPQLAGVPQSRRKRSGGTLADRLNTLGVTSPDATTTANNVSPRPGSLPEPMVSTDRDSAALHKTLRVELQTTDPRIRIIWFVQQETKPVIPGSKGT
jgi:hypothetical protein